MTTQEMQQLAAQICGNLEASEWQEMADILFDQVEVDYSVAEIQAISEGLMIAGVDVKPICKRKHPV